MKINRGVLVSLILFPLVLAVVLSNIRQSYPSSIIIPTARRSTQAAIVQVTPAVLGTSTAVPTQPDLLGYIRNMVDLYLATKNFAGPQGSKGDKGDAGASGNVSLSQRDGETTSVINSIPVVSYYQPNQVDNFSGASVAAFTQLSATDFAADGITTLNNLLVGGPATFNAGLNANGTSTLQALSVSGQASFGSLNETSGTTTLQSLVLSSITGSPQCLHVDSNGVVSGVGSDCGGGTGGGGTINSGTQGLLSYYASPGTTISSATNLWTNNSAVSIGSTSAVSTLFIQGSGSLEPFRVSSSSGTSLFQVAANGSTTLFSLGNGVVKSAGGSLYNGLVGNSDLVNSSITISTSTQGLIGGGVVALGGTLNIGLAPGVITSVATGTSGNTFNISTSTNSLTINLPTASSLNTGLLSSNDWNNFNNKTSSQWTSNVNSLFNNTGYQVGINSSTPTANLVVEGSSTNPTFPIFTVASSSNISQFLIGPNGSTTITSLSAGGIVQSTASGQLYNSTVALGSQVSGVLSVLNGGTGTSTVPTQTGQLLGADGTGSNYAPITLINGANITITTSTPGQITIAASGGSFNPCLSAGYSLQYNNNGSFGCVASLITDGTLFGYNATSSTVSFNIQGSSGSTNTIFNVASSSGSSYLSVSSAGVIQLAGNVLGLATTTAAYPSLIIPAGTAPTTAVAGSLFATSTSGYDQSLMYASGGNGNFSDNLNNTITSPRDYWVCAKANGGTCVWNGINTTTVANISDTNDCQSVNSPCRTLAGVQAKLANKTIKAIVTIHLADTADTGSDCYSPNQLVFTNPTVGTKPSNQSQSARPDNFPPNYIYFIGNTASTTKVNISGTCGSNAATYPFALSFDSQTTARINGVQLKGYATTSVFGFPTSIISAHGGSTVYAENLTCTGNRNVNANEHTACVGAYDKGSDILVGGTQAVTNEFAWIAAASGGTANTTDPSNSVSANTNLTFSSSVAGGQVMNAGSGGTIFTDRLTATLSGSGTYTYEQAYGAGSLIWYTENYAASECPAGIGGNGGCMNITLNNSNLTVYYADEGAYIDSDCDNFNEGSCTATQAPLIRSRAQVGGMVRNYTASPVLGPDIVNGGGCVEDYYSTTAKNTTHCSFNNDTTSHTVTTTVATLEAPIKGDPTSPLNGEIWTNLDRFKVRDNAASPATHIVAYWPATATGTLVYAGNVSNGIAQETNLLLGLNGAFLQAGTSSPIWSSYTLPTTTPGAIGQLMGVTSTSASSTGFINLVAGANISITTSTPGQITITASGTTGLNSFAGMTGPAITISTTSDANLSLNIITGANNATFTPTWLGQLAVSRGGTGGSTLTAGDILFGNDASPIATSSSFIFTTSSGLTVAATSTLATTTAAQLTVSNFSPGTFCVHSVNGLLQTVASDCGAGVGSNYWSTGSNSIFNNSGYLVGINSSTPIANLSVVGSSTAPTLSILTVASSSGISYLNVSATGATSINQLTVSGTTTLASAATIINGASYFWPSAIPNTNKILQSDSAGNLTWVTDQTGGGGSLSGGTNGFATVWTGTSTVSTGIQMDNGVVAGINATSSSFTFDIQGRAGIAPFEIASSSGAKMLSVDQNGNLGIGSSTPNAVLVVEAATTSPTTDLFQAASSTGAVLFNVTSLGNVGIGSTTPGAKLVIQGTSGSAANLLTISSSSNSSLLVVTANGNVGVATGSPTSTFTVQGEVAGTDFKGFGTATSTFSGPLSVATIFTSASSTTALIIGSTSTPQMLGFDSVNNVLQVGNGAGSSNPVILILDTKNTSGDPALAINGSMYYNSNMGQMRCYINGSWASCGSSNTVASGTTFAIANGGIFRPYICAPIVNTSTTTDRALASTTASEQVFSSNCQVPANFLTAGKVIKIHMSWDYSALATIPSFTGRIKACTNANCVGGTAVNLYVSAANTPGARTPAGGGSSDFEFVANDNTSGTFGCDGSSVPWNSTEAGGFSSIVTGLPTSSFYIVPSIQFGATNAGNAVSITSFYVSQEN